MPFVAYRRGKSGCPTSHALQPYLRHAGEITATAGRRGVRVPHGRGRQG